MRRLILGLVLIAGLAGFCSSASAAVIVTTSGEEIVCTIVEDRGTYLVVDDHGYRRYVLKTAIRSLDREGPRPPARLLHTLDFSAGYQVIANCQKIGPNSLRMIYGYPIGEIGTGTIGFMHGRGEITNDSYIISDPMAGPFLWSAVQAGFVWQHSESWISPTFEANVGYYFIDHSLSDSAVALAQREDAFVKAPSSSVELREIAESARDAFGIHISGGAALRITPRIWFVTQVSMSYIKSEIRRHRVYHNTQSNEDFSLTEEKPYSLATVQLLMGVRFRL